MKLLMLGGTEFVGRAIVEDALARGWEVTLFHRGRHDPPAGVREVLGDRTEPGALAKGLAAGEWEAVVDTWKAAPSVVREATRLLTGRAGRYAYVSSISVYAEPAPPGPGEEAPVVAGSSTADAVDYAADKRGGELAAVEAFGADRALLVRAGLVLGPYENVGRLPWWLNRVARGGPVLAPGPRDLALQYIDVRDLAAWTLDALVAERAGPYNLTSEPGHTTMGALLDACVEVTGSDAELRWTDPQTVLAADIEPWIDLPVWLPPGELHDTAMRRGVSKALAAGLRCRPAAETVADTWEWLRGIGGEVPPRPGRPALGLDPAVEAKVLGG